MTEQRLLALFNLLKTDLDIMDCIKNCSNKGICEINLNGEFYCECFEHFIGSDCKIDARLCSSLQCLNNGTCNDLIVNKTYDFNCSCLYPFYGQRCEKIYNLCQNKTCSNHGICVINKTHMSTCVCFKGYTGDNCETSDT